MGNRHADGQAVSLHNGLSKKKAEPGSPRPPPRRARGQMAALVHATPQQMHRVFIEK